MRSCCGRVCGVSGGRWRAPALPRRQDGPSAGVGTKPIVASRTRRSPAHAADWIGTTLLACCVGRHAAEAQNPAAHLTRCTGPCSPARTARSCPAPAAGRGAACPATAAPSRRLSLAPFWVFCCCVFCCAARPGLRTPERAKRVRNRSRVEHGAIKRAVWRWMMPRSADERVFLRCCPRPARKAERQQPLHALAASGANLLQGTRKLQ